ncbi:MAG: glutaredoxin family protein [Fusobacteria bacterium]|nr:glutaredoxin family protein [Fusobacteriota bacterium]
MSKVIVYSTPTCRYCVLAKEYLDEIGVAYEEVNVAVDRKAAEEMIAKSGQMGVPVIDFKGEIIIGFNKGRLSELAK